MNPLDDRLVEPHSFDRDRRLAGEKRHDLLVFMGELTALLLREVEVPVHDVPHDDRDTEKAPHCRVPGRKAPEVRALCHVGKAKRAPLAEQDAENPVVTGQVPDLGSRLLVDSRRDEAFQA
jgi:hypothetical protein